MCVAGNAVTETMGPIVKNEGSVLIDDPQLLPLTTSSARREIRRLPAWDDFLSAPQVIQYKKKKEAVGQLFEWKKRGSKSLKRRHMH